MFDTIETSFQKLPYASFFKKNNITYALRAETKIYWFKRKQKRAEIARLHKCRSICLAIYSEYENNQFKYNLPYSIALIKMVV
jgi:hypothetical protein